MKNARFEQLGRMQRQYHRNHPWGLSEGSLYIPHSYDDKSPDGLSWWDDVGFILNGRRVIVWWQHPRQVYSDKIEDVAWEEAGDSPRDNWLTKDSTPNYKRVGKSRKKIVSYTCRQPSAEQRQYYDKLHNAQKRLVAEGIDYRVEPSYSRERLTWATGISLVAPVEVRNEVQIKEVAQLARRLILGKTTLDSEFPGYHYTKADWLREQGNGTKNAGEAFDLLRQLPSDFLSDKQVPHQDPAAQDLNFSSR